MFAEHSTEVSLGEVLGAMYDAFLEELGDEDLAELATTVWLQEKIAEGALAPVGHAAAA